MTEQEWHACVDPYDMLEWLRGRASERKLRLFACACARRVWHLLADEHFRAVVELAERYADGRATSVELDLARSVTLTRKADNLLEVASKASEAAAFAAEHTASTNSTELALGAKDAAGAFAWEAVGAARSASDAERWAAAWNAAEATELRGQAELLWDIYGNPFRPVTLDPGWRTPDVLSLAQAADEHRALPAGTLEPARLALVADALEDAGCDNADLLGHLRSEGSHVRGCWAVDLVLGWE